MNKTSIRRTRPAKPQRVVPVQKSSIATRENALSILHDFYMDAKKEIKGDTMVSINYSNQITNLSIMCAGFNLQLNFNDWREMYDRH